MGRGWDIIGCTCVYPVCLNVHELPVLQTHPEITGLGATLSLERFLLTSSLQILWFPNQVLITFLCGHRNPALCLAGLSED